MALCDVPSWVLALLVIVPLVGLWVDQRIIERRRIIDDRRHLEQMQHVVSNQASIAKTLERLEARDGIRAV